MNQIRQFHTAKPQPAVKLAFSQQQQVTGMSGTAIADSGAMAIQAIASGRVSIDSRIAVDVMRVLMAEIDQGDPCDAAVEVWGALDDAPGMITCRPGAESDAAIIRLLIEGQCNERA